MRSINGNDESGVTQVSNEQSRIPDTPPPEEVRRLVIKRWRSDSLKGLKNVDLHNAHILIIDDNPVQRSVLNKWMKDENYHNVTMCSSGDAAWEFLSKEDTECDMVLTDLIMPGLTGVNLLKLVRSHPRYRTIPVLLMSGEDKTQETTACAILEGSHDFLFKPLNKPLLFKKMTTVLENWMIKERELAYESLMKEKEDEIQKLTNELSVLAAENLKVMKAIETPIEGITRTLSKILEDKSLQNLAVKKDLEEVFYTIRTNKDLYAPVIKELLLKQEMNPEARSLLLSCTDAALGRRVSLPTFPVALIEESVAGLKDWDFNVFEHSDKDFPALIKTMFADFGLLERFNIPVPQLERFILAVRDGYKANPYHNFTHAFDVLQTVYCFLTTMGAGAYLTHLDIFAMLTAAFCHDLHHPGLNNTYMINNETELALTYNDKSVLESHHAASAFKLLHKPECNILKNLSADEKKEFRSSVIAIILSTDMSSHFSITTKLEQRIKSQKLFDRETKDDRLMIMETIMKSSDLSNIAKPWPVARAWCSRISEEYFKQGDVERNAGKYPVADFMDRQKTTAPRTTSNFIDLFGLHMFDLLRQILPNTSGCFAQLMENRKSFGEWILNEQNNLPTPSPLVVVNPNPTGLSAIPESPLEATDDNEEEGITEGDHVDTDESGAESGVSSENNSPDSPSRGGIISNVISKTYSVMVSSLTTIMDVIPGPSPASASPRAKLASPYTTPPATPQPASLTPRTTTNPRSPATPR